MKILMVLTSHEPTGKIRARRRAFGWRSSLLRITYSRMLAQTLFSPHQKAASLRLTRRAMDLQLRP